MGYKDGIEQLEVQIFLCFALSCQFELILSYYAMV